MDLVNFTKFAFGLQIDHILHQNGFIKDHLQHQDSIIVNELIRYGRNAFQIYCNDCFKLILSFEGKYIERTEYSIIDL